MKTLPIKDDDTLIPLEHGFYKKICRRKSGKTASRYDIYIYDPLKRKFRSKKGLQEHMAKEYPDIPASVIVSAWCLPEGIVRQSLKSSDPAVSKPTDSKASSNEKKPRISKEAAKEKKSSSDPKETLPKSKKYAKNSLTPKEMLKTEKSSVLKEEEGNSELFQNGLQTDHPVGRKSQLSLKNFFKKQILNYSSAQQSSGPKSPSSSSSESSSSDSELSSGKENEEKKAAVKKESTRKKKKMRNNGQNTPSTAKLEKVEGYLLQCLIAQDWYTSAGTDTPSFTDLSLKDDEDSVPQEPIKSEELESRLIELGIGMDTSFEYTSNDNLIV